MAVTGDSAREPATEMFDLANFLPYLLNRAGARLAIAWTQESRQLGVALQEWRVLAALLSHQPQRMSELAAMTTIDRTTLSRLVSRMEQNGLVSRGRSGEDGREVQIELTESGVKVGNGLLPMAGRYETVAMEGFTPAEAKAFKEMLKRVFDNLDRL
ncbi:MAG: hypothetical protein JWO28_1084 [Hyphomicrobiales bacterium]|jgi:DNA-binding MarR family transcriptional regulator|nr:hypothetical protein [Hyphomicrobiales bacterium]